MKTWAVIIILLIALLGFLQTAQADPVIYEGELITTWTGTGQDDTPYQSKVCKDYALPRCWQKDGKNPRPNPGKFKIYFQCEESVLNQMQADGVNILWSKEMEESE